jgi:hypothetical protein
VIEDGEVDEVAGEIAGQLGLDLLEMDEEELLREVVRRAFRDGVDALAVRERGAL